LKSEVIEPDAGESVSPPTQSLCPNCGNLFPYRSNKTYCSSNCRKAHSKRQSRRETPVNARYNFTKAREQYEKFELAERLAERLYSIPPRDRLGYLESIIRLARDGHCPKVRDILTTPQLIRPNPQNRYLFYRGRPSVYCTIAQAANRYTVWSPWSSTVDRVVKGLAAEPPTGEVYEDGTVDDDGRGFKGRIAGSRKSVVTPNIDRAA